MSHLWVTAREWVCHKELTVDHYTCQQTGKQSKWKSKLGGEKQRFPSKSEQDFWRDPRLCWEYSFPGIFFLLLVLWMPWHVTQIFETEALSSPDARSIHCRSFLPVDPLSLPHNCPHQRSPHFTQGHFASSGIRLSHLRSPHFKGVAHFWSPSCVGIQRSGTLPSSSGATLKGYLSSRVSCRIGWGLWYHCNKIHPSLWPILSPSLLTQTILSTLE